MKRLINLLCIAIIGGAVISPEYALTLARPDGEQVNSFEPGSPRDKKVKKNRRAKKQRKHVRASRNQNAGRRYYNGNSEDILQNQSDDNAVNLNPENPPRRKKKRRSSRRNSENVLQSQNYNDSSVTSNEERPPLRKKKRKNHKKRIKAFSGSDNRNTVMATYKKKRKSPRKNAAPRISEAWKDEIVAFNSTGETGIIDPTVDSSKINSSQVKMEAKPITELAARNTAPIKLNSTIFKPTQVISEINIDKNLKAISEKVTATPNDAPVIHKVNRPYTQQPKHNYRKDFKETIRFRQELEKYRQTFA